MKALKDGEDAVEWAAPKGNVGQNIVVAAASFLQLGVAGHRGISGVPTKKTKPMKAAWRWKAQTGAVVLRSSPAQKGDVLEQKKLLLLMWDVPHPSDSSWVILPTTLPPPCQRASPPLWGS